MMSASDPHGAVSVLALELEKMLELRIQSAQAERATLREELDGMDAKLKKLIVAIGKRPTQTDVELTELARQKEFTHATTNMSLMKEKEFIREMDAIKQKKKDYVEYNKRQQEIEALKISRTNIASELRAKEEMLDELFTGSRKLNVANTLKCNPAEIVEKKITIPEDNMPRIIGKGGSGIKALEEEFRVVILSERAHVLRIMGLEDDVSTAFSAIQFKASGVTETLNLHPALKACLMVGKASITKAIQDKHDVKINFIKTDNTCKIYGQAAGVAGAKAEVLAIPYSKIKIKVDPAVVPKLVGKGGANLRSMFDENLLQVDLLREEGALAIYGLQSDAEPVAAAIRTFCTENKEAQEVLTVSQFALHNCIQSIGAIKRNGAVIDCVFGKNDEDCTITVRGAQAGVTAALDAVKAIIAAFHENTVTMEFHPSAIPSLIGRKGETINKLRSDFSTANVHLSGSSVSVYSADKEVREAAINAINLIANANYSETVPMDKEATITLRGSSGEPTRNKLIVDLNLGVSIDTDNETVRLVGRQEDVEAGKIILADFRLNSQTDDVPVQGDDSGAVSNMIPELEKKFSVQLFLVNKRQNLRIVGTKQNCAKAKAELAAILEGAKGSGSVIMPVDASDFLVIIGTKGRNLDALEKQLGVKIDIIKTKGAVRLRGTEERVHAAKEELAAIIVDNAKVSDSVSVPKDMSSDAASRCLAEVSRLFGLDLNVRFTDRSFALRGKKELVDPAKAFIQDIISGVISDAIPLMDRHAGTLSASRFTSIAESFGVYIRLDLSNDKLLVSGAAGSLKAVVEKVYSHLNSVFPMMYESKAASSFCIADLASSRAVRGIEREMAVKIHFDRYMGKMYVRGEPMEVRNSLRVLDEKIAAWEATHAVIEGVDESALASLLANQGEQLNALEKETGAAFRVSRPTRTIVIEGSSKAEVAAAQAVLAAKLPASVAASGGAWEVKIHPDVVGSIIGKQGAIIKKLRADSGAAIDYDQDASVLKVSGPEENVALAREKIEEIVVSRTPTEIAVPNASLPLMIGTKGANIKAMEAETGAKIDVDKSRDVVVVRGTVEVRDAAAALIRQRLTDAGFEEQPVAPPRVVVTQHKGHAVGIGGDFVPEDTATKNYNKEKRLAKQSAFKMQQEALSLEAAAESVAPVRVEQVAPALAKVEQVVEQKRVAPAPVMAPIAKPIQSSALDRPASAAGDEDINFFGLPQAPIKSPTSTHVAASVSTPAPLQAIAPPTAEMDANTAFLLNLLNASGSKSSSAAAKLTPQPATTSETFKPSDASKPRLPPGIAPPGFAGAPSDDVYARSTPAQPAKVESTIRPSGGSVWGVPIRPPPGIN